MNEILTNNFDYSVLDSSTAEYLKDRENSMSKTLENTAEKLGEDLYKAQQKLANHNGGVFEEWYTALGFKKQNVYNFINRHKYVVQLLDNPTDIETFQELPARMKNEMSKPSANPEVNQKVFDGDITTHKEYKALEKRLRDAEHNVESHKNWYHEIATKLQKRDEENELLQSKLEDAENKEPEFIERYSEPDDYQEIKNMNDHLANEREYYKKIADEFREEIENLNTPKHYEKPISSFDYTDIILLFVKQIDEIISNNAMEYDRKKIENYISNLIKRMDE